MKINDGDDDDYDELCYSFLDIMSGSTIILCQFSGFIETVSSHNGSTRPDCVLNLCDSLSIHFVCETVAKLVKTIF